MTKAEQESVLRWDQDEQQLWLYTAHEPTARRWARLGYAIEVERRHAGVPIGWRSRAPLAALKLRALGADGTLKRRRKTGGRSFSAR